MLIPYLGFVPCFIYRISIAQYLSASVQVYVRVSILTISLSQDGEYPPFLGYFSKTKVNNYNKVKGNFFSCEVKGNLF